MKEEKMNSNVEIFICNFARENGANCYDKGAKELTDNLKKWSKENHKNDIKVVRSGCLGKCEEGIAIACYPDKKFLLNVQASDEISLKKGLEETLLKIKN